MTLKQKMLDNRLVIPLMGAPGIKLSKTTLKENLLDDKVQFRTLSLLMERFEPDGIFTFMDLTVELDALGLKVKYPDNDNPSILEHPLNDIEDLENIEKAWKGPSGRMIKFIRLMGKMSAEIPIINGGYVIGPFSMAGELMGVNDIAISVITDPDLVKKVLEFSNKVIAEYISALFDAGADTVAVLEPSAVILSPEHYREFSLLPFKRLAETIAQPLILHICGNTTHLIEQMVESGAAGLSLDSDVSFGGIKSQVPEEITLIGNLSPAEVFLQGNVEEVREAALSLKKEMTGRKNFIISSGCDLPVDTPLENIEVFMKTAREEL
ncbi:MAG TPA: uroporphyrinogen decarboxylase family protein [Halanaerobiales bacterium]|nr:uroporphyrinogen decarboxylase family protein [Halanaerobiales bacterium]